VALEARASRDTEVTVTLEAGDDATTTASASGTAGPGRPFQTVLLVTAPAAGGALRLRARVDARGPDDAPEDDALEAVVLAGASRRALLLEATPGAGEALARALGGAAAVERVDPAGAGEALRAGTPEVVVVVDVPASALDPLVPALERALEGGATLVLAGARGAFGPGGWAGRASESLAPVTVGPGDERERPLGVVLALDASGSMATEVGTSTRFKDAVDALAPALDLERGPLRPGDLLGVLAFAQEPHEVRPLSALTAGEGDLRALLAGRAPTGDTDIGRALAAGLEALGRLDADAERLLVLASDGGDQHPGVHTATLERLATTLPKERLTVLTVLVGVNAAQRDSVRALLAPLVAAGVDCPIEDVAFAGAPLRALVEGELLLRTSARREGAFAVVVEEEGRALGLRLPETIGAYAPAKARPDARVLARVQDPGAERERPSPAVVVARRGLGRVVALPVEPVVAAAAVASLGEAWLPPARGDVTLEARRDGPALDLSVRSHDPLPLGLTVHVSASGGPTVSGALVAETPHRARGRLAVPARTLLVSLTDDDRLLARVSVPDAAHDETVSDAPDHALLSSIAAATGGRVLGRLPPPAAAGAADARPLGPLAALVALLALLLDAGLATWRVRRSASS
jgi:Mg-chelatase subunit ChlD